VVVELSCLLPDSLVLLGGLNLLILLLREIAADEAGDDQNSHYYK
jgi:hypothetical protein